MSKLLWLDLETTGLDARKCDILEVSLMEADLFDPFNVSPVYDTVVWFPESKHGDIPEGDRQFILDMHTKNGLLEACARSTSPGLRQVEHRLLDFVPWVEAKDDRPVLAGSTVHFDHDFITQHMPELARRLSHRHYDVSALKLFCQSMGMPKFRKAEAHRAQADIWESITHAKECTTWLKANLKSKQF
jgi:oligoribonuclease